MIQRIQTIWLLLASAAIFALFLFPFMQFTDIDGTAKAVKVTGLYQYTGQEVVLNESYTLLTIGTVIVGILPFIVLFFFRNRKKQISYSYITIILIIAYSFWLVETAKSALGSVQLQLQNYGIGVLLPSVAILFMILALRGIRSDEKLIKSADRLR